MAKVDEDKAVKITNSQSQPQVVYPPDSPPFSSTPVLSWNECLSDQTTSYRAASSEVKYIWNSWSHRKETRPAPQKLRCRVLFTVMTRLGPEEYTVGWVCPLEVEQVAALEMLDEEHDRLPQHLTDHNIYHLGNIGKQNVVIAGLPDRGNNSAATVVTQMRTTFPNLRFGLLVGIGGGVPTTTDDGIVRLGDIVVSVPTSVHPGTVQYDRGKAEVGKFQRTGALDRPPVVLLNAVRELSVHRARSKQDPIMNNIKRIDTSIRGLRKYKYPGSAEDHLYRSDYVHLRPGLPCDECGCDPAQRIERYSGGNNHDREDEDSYIVVHRGTIASGEAVIKDGIVRDNLAKEYGILCFETEAAGALAGFHCITIRGISDYCDSHKNDRWHGYAAAAAAAYARELFFHMSITETRRCV